MALPDLSVQETSNPYDYAVLRLFQQTEQSVAGSLKNRSGVLLTVSPTEHTVTLYLKEYTTATEYYAEVDCTISADDQTVTATFTEEDLTTPGIFHGEFVVRNSAGKVIYRIKCFADVEPALSETQTIEPLTVAEVKGKIRDRGADENVLLVDEEFSDAEVCMAVISAVGTWNETLPLNSNLSFTQLTFPYKENLITGVMADLLHTAALNLVRNRMPYQAGGVATDDKQRADAYIKLASSYRQEYRQWAIMHKTAMDRALCFGTTYNESFQ